MSVPAVSPRQPVTAAGAAQPLGEWKKAVDPVRLSLYGQIVVAISAIQMYLGSLNSMRPALMLMLLAFGAIALNPNSVRWANVGKAFPPKAVIALLIIACGSAVFGLSFGGSANYILQYYLKILAFFFLLVIGIRDTRDLALLMWGFLISVGILVVLSLTVLDLEATSSGLGRLEGNAGFDANDLGMIFLMGLPLALLFMYNARPLGRIIAGAILVGIPMSIALTGSRGAMVGLAFVGPSIFFSLKRVAIWKRTAAIAVVIGGLIVGAPEGYWEQMRTIFSAEEDYNVTEDYGRVALAKRGLGYMLDYPVFGVGIANFPRAEGTISPIAVDRLSAGEAVQWIAPHNTYAQVGAELGLIGFGIWLTLLYHGTVGLWKLRRRIPAAWSRQGAERRFLREACLFLPTSVLAFAVTSFFLSHAYTPPFYILLGFVTGIHVLVRSEMKRDALARPMGGRPPAGPPRRMSRFAGAR